MHCSLPCSILSSPSDEGQVKVAHSATNSLSSSTYTISLVGGSTKDFTDTHIHLYSPLTEQKVHIPISYHSDSKGEVCPPEVKGQQNSLPKPEAPPTKSHEPIRGDFPARAFPYWLRYQWELLVWLLLASTAAILRISANRIPVLHPQVFSTAVISHSFCAERRLTNTQSRSVWGWRHTNGVHGNTIQHWRRVHGFVTSDFTQADHTHFCDVTGYSPSTTYRPLYSQS